jgi:hypothetical protein
MTALRSRLSGLARSRSLGEVAVKVNAGSSCRGEACEEAVVAGAIRPV